MSPHRRWLSVLLAVGTLALTGSVTRAQSRPMPDEDPYQRSGRPAPTNNFGGYGNYENGYPASDVRIAVDANARAAWARQQYYRAQDALNGAIRTLQMQFDASPELKDAMNAEKQAYEALLTTRSESLKAVVNDPRYQANMQLRKELSAQIAQLQQQKGITANDLMPYALTKLAYATAMTTMEVGVLSGDSKVHDAREKLMSAGARVAEVRAHFDSAIRGNPDLIAMRRQIDDARINYIAAETFRDGAVDAAYSALNYAYSHDRNSTLNPGGYGYGYSYPFGFRY